MLTHRKFDNLESIFQYLENEMNCDLQFIIENTDSVPAMRKQEPWWTRCKKTCKSLAIDLLNRRRPTENPVGKNIGEA